MTRKKMFSKRGGQLKRIVTHLICYIIIVTGLVSCTDNVTPPADSIQGYQLLNDLNGHWVGSNQTSFGFYDWFAFDFRPISPSHCHSIYEGSTNENIITSIFLADYEDKQQIMARNGGWLGNQYRTTYFVLDKEERNGGERYYRLVDAVGGINRAYIEFKFEGDSIHIDAYKDNSGTLDQPVHHMGFAGSNRNPGYADDAEQVFAYPQPVSEVNLNGQFNNLIDPDSALFLEEQDDPFPKADHGHLSDLSINITRNPETMDAALLLFISKEELVSAAGTVNFNSIENAVVRTIDIGGSEAIYTATYLHPDSYYLTVFSDEDNNGFPSAGDFTSQSMLSQVNPESLAQAAIEINIQLN